MKTLIEKNYAVAIELSGSLLSGAQQGWKVLSKKFNINFISSRSPIPHLTVTAGFTSEPDSHLNRLLETASSSLNPFIISAQGLGVFVRETPVVYIRWSVPAELQNCYNVLGKQFSHAWRKASVNTLPEFWVPKATLAYKDIDYAHLTAVLSELGQIDFEGTMTVASLALLSVDRDEGERLITRFRLTGSSD